MGRHQPDTEQRDRCATTMKLPAMPEPDPVVAARADAYARSRARARLWLGPGSWLLAAAPTALAYLVLGDHRLVGCVTVFVVGFGHLLSLVELVAVAHHRAKDRLANWLAAYWLLAVPAALLLLPMLDRCST
jgi:hypothetical protein